MLDVKCWMLDAGCWMLDAGCWMLDAGCWMLGIHQSSVTHHPQFLSSNKGTNRNSPNSSFSNSVSDFL
ncbi:hypothetical protein EI546_01070 [Aequorivita sp. H23M31]|uniref:Phosphotransferase n=1 Tax=Aequorivita ciconiae TaxID=2494375 RepID=A0A410FZE9_9FLAO|nr:hypothetical protein EI546_01070 [Aequorivita sp. H23M31]